MGIKSMAIDLADKGVSCVALNPGWVKTGIGGPNATFTPAESVTKLKHIIDGLTTAESGKFFNHDGTEII